MSAQAIERFFAFCFSWDAVAWSGCPRPQQVELPAGGWAKSVTGIHAMIEDPARPGLFALFFTGRHGSGAAAVGVMQVAVEYSGGSQSGPAQRISNPGAPAAAGPG